MIKLPIGDFDLGIGVFGLGIQHGPKLSKFFQNLQDGPKRYKIDCLQNGSGATRSHGTGVHPCSCNSPNLPARDTRITNTDGRALSQTYVTRLVG